MRSALRTAGIAAAWIAALVIWLAVGFAIYNAFSTTTSCDRPVNCDVSPQDAWQPH